MYDVADWGRPAAASELGSGERFTAQLPPSLLRVLRSRARAQGVSLNVLIDRLLHQALAMTAPEELSRVGAGD